MTGLALEQVGSPEDVKGRSLWENARRRLMRNPAAVVSLYVVAILIVLALFGPLLWTHRYDTIYPDRVAVAPTFRHLHLLGTDMLGRDVVARILLGLRISLLVAAAATAMALTIGVLYAAIAGLAGGFIDKAMVRFIDVLSSVPLIFFVIASMVVAETDSPLANLMCIIVAIGAVEWLAMARLVRGQIVTLRNKEFVQAARAAGAKPGQIALRHIAPNLLGPVLVSAARNVPAIILMESMLSFIGLGVQAPLTSLGRLIKEGADQSIAAPWLLISPAAAMLITLLALNSLGDGLRNALDPTER
jgi:oligopeptide transport system permease protein